MLPLLRTKISIPPARQTRVERLRLVEQISEGMKRALMLVVAPAGFGKTTLIAEWARRASMPVAWLSLERADHTLERFLSYFIHTLQQISPLTGQTALAMLHSGQAVTGKAILFSLLNDLSEIPNDFTIIQKKTGMSLKELSNFVKKSGLSKHGEIRDMLREKLGLGHGDANTLVHAVLESDGRRAAEGKSADAVLDEIYSGAKAGLRPIHEKLIKEINKFGGFEIAPKKGYVSLRRKKQFATIVPKTNTRFEVGINAKDFKKNACLLEQPKGSMCNYIVQIMDAKEVDAELVAWIKSAFDGAG